MPASPITTSEMVFADGLETKMEPFTVKPPGMLMANNVEQTTNNIFDKRAGFQQLSNIVQTGGDIINGAAIGAFQNQLLQFDNTNIYSYLNATDSWVNRGPAVSCISSGFTVYSSRINIQSNPDAICDVDGYIQVFAWENNSGTGAFSVVDIASGTFIVNNMSLPFGAHRIKLVSNPNKSQIAIVYTLDDLNIYYQIISTPRWQIPTIPILLATNNTPASSPTHYDVIWEVGQTVPTIAFFNGAVVTIQVGATTINVATYTYANSNCLTLLKDSLGTYWVGVYGTASSGVVLYNYNGSTTTHILDATNPAVNMTLGELPQQAGTVALLYEVSGTNFNNIYGAVVNLTRGIIDLYNNQFGFPINYPLVRKAGLASDIFTYDNKMFVNVIAVSDKSIYAQNNSNLQPTYFTMQLDPVNNLSTAVGKSEFQIGGTYRDNGLLSSVSSWEDGLFLFATQREGELQTTNNNYFYQLGVDASLVDFAPPENFSYVVNDSNFNLVGSIPQVYDGKVITEKNYNLYPELPNPTDDGYSPFSTLQGAADGYLYQYQAVYQYVNAIPQIEQSTPSPIVSIILTAPQHTVGLQLPTLPFTNKQEVLIVVYRTQANLNVFTKIGYVVNDPTVDYITFVDTGAGIMTDTTPIISAAEPIYTYQQVINSAPPSCSIMALFLNRVVLAGLPNDPYTIWYSQDRQNLSAYNTVPVEWSPYFTLGVSDLGGPITALAELNGNLIAFKQNLIFGFAGTGPTNALGTSGGFGPASIITQDTGCTNPNSIIKIPASDFQSGGLMYQSNKGIYLLDVGLINHYIGQQVEAFNNLTITSAELLDAKNEVVFTTSDGTILVYNYYYNRWYPWTNLPAQDAVMWNNQLTICDQYGIVRTQVPGQYYDEYKDQTPAVNMVLQTPWLEFEGQRAGVPSSGLQSYGNFYSVTLLARLRGSHLLNMSAAYDYIENEVDFDCLNSNLVSNTFGSEETFGYAGDVWGGGDATPYQFQFTLQSGLRKQAVRFTFYDTPLDGYQSTQGFSPISLKVKFNSYTGAARLPKRQKSAASRQGTKLPT